MRALWAAGMLLRRLRNERGIVLLIALLVASTSFVFAAAPRLFNRVSDDALHSIAQAARPQDRNLALDLNSMLTPGFDGGVASVRAHGDQLATQIPPSLTGVVSERSMRVTTVRFYVPQSAARRDPHLASLPGRRAGRGAPGRRAVAEGSRRPAPLGCARRGRLGRDAGAARPTRGRALDTGGQRDRRQGRRPPDTHPRRQRPADRHGTRTERRLRQSRRIPHRADRAAHRRRVRAGRSAVGVLVRRRRPARRGAAWERGQADHLRNRVHGAGDVPRDLAERRCRSITSGASMVDPQRLDAGAVDTLRSDLHRLGLISGVGTGAPGTVTVLTGLPAILDKYAAERALSESVLSIAAIGPFGLAAGAMGMVAILLVRRRRANVTLARGRGASGALVLGTQLWDIDPHRGRRCAVRAAARRRADSRRATTRSPVSLRSRWARWRCSCSSVRAGRAPGVRSGSWSGTTPRSCGCRRAGS